MQLHYINAMYVISGLMYVLIDTNSMISESKALIKCHFSMEMLGTHDYDIPLIRVGRRRNTDMFLLFCISDK